MNLSWRWISYTDSPDNDAWALAYKTSRRYALSEAPGCNWRPQTDDIRHAMAHALMVARKEAMQR